MKLVSTWNYRNHTCINSQVREAFHITNPMVRSFISTREELDKWLLRNRNATNDEIEQQAADYLIRKGRVKL